MKVGQDDSTGFRLSIIVARPVAQPLARRRSSRITDRPRDYFLTSGSTISDAFQNQALFPGPLRRADAIVKICTGAGRQEPSPRNRPKDLAIRAHVVARFHRILRAR